MLPCVYPQRAFCFSAYPHTASSIALHTVIVGTHPETLSCRVLILNPCTHRYYCAAYFYYAYAPETLSHCVATQFSLFCSAYPCNSPVSALRTHALAPLITCVLLIRAEMAVHQCATVSRMPRSDHALERSPFTDSLSTSLSYRSSF